MSLNEIAEETGDKPKTISKRQVDAMKILTSDEVKRELAFHLDGRCMHDKTGANFLAFL